MVGMWLGAEINTVRILVGVTCLNAVFSRRYQLGNYIHRGINKAS
jgi:hypothetical protein